MFFHIKQDRNVISPKKALTSFAISAFIYKIYHFHSPTIEKVMNLIFQTKKKYFNFSVIFPAFATMSANSRDDIKQ